MDFVIVTGLSGAGKSRTIESLEDIGYYCVDNMPPKLIIKFADICRQSDGQIMKIAIVTDIRGGNLFDGLFDELDILDKNDFRYKLLFLDASDSTLMRRFKETRRNHPLLNYNDCSTANAIKLEREMLAKAKSKADYIIDTSMLSASQLKERICKIFLDNISSGMLINFMSFGFKYGFPVEADLMFDVRCLPNPFYVDELKHKTGLDQDVRDYVMSFNKSLEFFNKLKDLINFLIPMYMHEGKTQLTIAVGCTGGKHRSVTFIENLYNYVSNNSNKVTINHRDINRH